MKHVVMFSGGIASWAAAKRVVAKHGPADVTLLFADTLIEDEDTYRFLVEAAQNVGAPLVRIADGRTPWQVFRDERFVGNARVDPCSRVLKREVLDRWRDEHCDPADTTLHFGLDWTELHRVERIEARLAPWRCSFPLCEPPYRMKLALLEEARAEGIEPPRLYAMGFAHGNCGGFCVKAGQAQFAKLHAEMPCRYGEHEAQEESMRLLLGDVAVMRDRTGGIARPLPMREFRERLEQKQAFDLFDLGGCGCITETED